MILFDYLLLIKSVKKCLANAKNLGHCKWGLLGKFYDTDYGVELKF